MKNPAALPPEIIAALSKVEDIADSLASTFCISSMSCETKDGQHDPHMIASCLDNLDEVASATTFDELKNAPAMLNAVARAFRQTFPSDSLGWDDAATLTNVACLINEELPDEDDERMEAHEKASRQFWDVRYDDDEEARKDRASFWDPRHGENRNA